MTATSRRSGTCTLNRRLSALPSTKASASRALARILFPALDILPHSFQVAADQGRQRGPQFVALGLRQIDPIPFGEDVEREHRHVMSAVKRDRPVAAALALASTREADLARSAGPAYFVPGVGMHGQVPDDGGALVVGQPGGSRVAQVA